MEDKQLSYEEAPAAMARLRADGKRIVQCHGTFDLIHPGHIIHFEEARELNPREVTLLRRALAWRDEIARSRDRAPFRVVGDPVLLEIVVSRPESAGDLARLKGMSPRLARERGGDLLTRLSLVDDLPEEALEPYPRWRGNGAGRPTPDEEAVAGRIRELRTEKAAELDLDRGILLSNAQILEIEEIPWYLGGAPSHLGRPCLAGRSVGAGGPPNRGRTLTLAAGRAERGQACAWPRSQSRP